MCSRRRKMTSMCIFHSTKYCHSWALYRHVQEALPPKNHQSNFWEESKCFRKENTRKCALFPDHKLKLCNQKPYKYALWSAWKHESILFFPLEESKCSPRAKCIPSAWRVYSVKKMVYALFPKKFTQPGKWIFFLGDPPGCKCHTCFWI